MRFIPLYNSHKQIDDSSVLRIRIRVSLTPQASLVDKGRECTKSGWDGVNFLHRSQGAML